jgi:hypothetical protein
MICPIVSLLNSDPCRITTASQQQLTQMDFSLIGEADLTVKTVGTPVSLILLKKTL